MLPRETANDLSQITIEKLDKNIFQVWKFRIMNFLMAKVYWEFITSDKKTPHNNKFKPIKLSMKNEESLILVFCECVRFHDCAYLRWKITKLFRWCESYYIRCKYCTMFILIYGLILTSQVLRKLWKIRHMLNHISIKQMWVEDTIILIKDVQKWVHEKLLKNPMKK